MTRKELKERPLSFSSLKEFSLSPKHYIHYLTKPRTETPDMLLGSAVHSRLLEPNEYEDKYCVAPKCDKRTTKGKEDWDKFSKENEGKKILTPEQSETVKRMAEAVMNYNPAGNIFEQLGTTEMRFDTEVHGLPVCGYIDGVGDKILVELKTCQSSRPEDFMREAYNRMYHLQAGIYHFASGQSRNFYYIAIEKDEPYNVTVLKATDEYLQRGISIMGKLCEQFNLCMDLDLFNQGYEFYNTNGMIETLDLPKYA